MAYYNEPPDQPTQEPIQPTQPSGRYYQPVQDPGQPNQSPYQQPGGQSKKPSKLLTVLLVIGVLIFAVGLAIGITNCREQQHADKYGADAPYTVTGVIVKADERRDSDGDKKYKVVIETEEELPDGSHTFESKMSRDYTYVRGGTGEKVEVTIGEDGHIDKVVKVQDD